MSGERDTPLSGLTVVEQAQGVAACYAGRLLAVMGARVIKVEPPGRGSPLRRSEPPLGGSSDASALFHYLNVNKEFLTCDVKSRQGRDLLRELIAHVDVLIDDTPLNERPPLGLDSQYIASEHPRLVHVSVLPFGASGEHSGYC